MRYIQIIIESELLSYLKRTKTTHIPLFYHFIDQAFSLPLLFQDLQGSLSVC